MTTTSAPHIHTPTSCANPAVSTAVLMLSTLPTEQPLVLPPTPAPDPLVDKWVAVINDAVQQGVTWFINAGIYLINAQKELGSERWQRMLDSCQLAMSERIAQMLMRIARNQALASAKHVSELPPTLTALYALSGASEEVVSAGIQSGDINPDMTAKQARAFVRKKTAKPTPPKPTSSFDTAVRRSRVQQAVESEASKWPESARTQLADLLEELARDIRSSVFQPR